MNRNNVFHESDRLEIATLEIREMTVPVGPGESHISATAEAISSRTKRNVTRLTIRRGIKWISGLAASVALLLGISAMLLGTPEIALAEVASAIENVRYVRWQQVETVKNNFDFLKVEKIDQKQTMYFDMKGHRSRLETHYGLPEGSFVTIQDQKLGKRMMLNPQSRTATLLKDKPNEQPEPMRHPFEPLMNSKDAKISRVQWNAVEHGYVELIDKNNGVEGTTRIWIDLQTRLPVRAEYALPDANLLYTMTEFVWTNALDNAETLFGMEVPTGYTVTTPEQLEQ